MERLITYVVALALYGVCYGVLYLVELSVDIEMSKAESMDRVTCLKNHGYIICHIIGDWYLVRMYPHRGIIYPKWIHNE